MILFIKIVGAIIVLVYLYKYLKIFVNFIEKKYDLNLIDSTMYIMTGYIVLFIFGGYLHHYKEIKKLIKGFHFIDAIKMIDNYHLIVYSISFTIIFASGLYMIKKAGIIGAALFIPLVFLSYYFAIVFIILFFVTLGGGAAGNKNQNSSRQRQKDAFIEQKKIEEYLVSQKLNRH